MSRQHSRRNLMLRTVRSLTQPASAPAAVVLLLLACDVASAADAKVLPTTAGPVLTEKRIVVKLDDLDLTAEAGIKAANERILDAARRACDYTSNDGDYVVGRNQVFRECLDRTMAAASGRLELLRLAAMLHRGAPIDSASSSASR